MKIEIGLSGIPSAGYGWEPDREPTSLDYHNPNEQPEDTPPEERLIGGEMIERFVFEDVPSGSDIVFKYRRLFEPDTIKPLKIVRVTVEGVDE